MKVRSRRITSEQVRLLLFKECDWKGRKLLFDSSTIEKVVADKNDRRTVKHTGQVPSIVEVLGGYSYLYKGPSEDASALGEMIFGAVAMNHKGVSLKIHIMDEPKKLMCTKVFFVPSPRRVSRVDRKCSAVDQAESPESRTNPLSVPSRDEVALSFSFDRGDSGFYGEHSLHSSVSSTCDFFSMFDVFDGNDSQDDFYSFHSPPGRKLSTSSTGSWQRRTSRSLATKFDLRSQSSNLLSVPTANSNFTSCDSQTYNTSNSSASSTSDSLSSVNNLPARRNKLGLALLISVSDNDEMDLIKRCVEHSPQLQTLVCRLRMATMAAGAGAHFVATLYKAACDAAEWLSDLMYGPRVEPMWLSCVAKDTSSTADRLLTSICTVLAAADTKHTNFFFSTLLTQILTYHLGWVTTVSPYDVLDPQHMADDPTTKRPYNALWAQLNDLCGSIGYPPRAARTIISGQNNTNQITNILVVITYFLRCGVVQSQKYSFDNTVVKVKKVIDVTDSCIKRTDATTEQKLKPMLKSSLKRNTTLSNLCETDCNASCSTSGNLKRAPTIMLPELSSSQTSSNSGDEERNVVFVLGDDEKLVGLKNKSGDGKSVKKTKIDDATKLDEATCRSKESPSKCCGQTQHSKSIKHSGFKFEFDKYPQIVTNYMKSKNLEILDRHYIGKPGNLKLDNFHFDPTVIPPIQEERCESCYKCQMIESMLQTPTNASELEFMNDMPRQSEPQYAKQTIQNEETVSPKNFQRKLKPNTILVNVTEYTEDPITVTLKTKIVEKDTKLVDDKPVVSKLIEFPMCGLKSESVESVGFDESLLGGVYDHYVPDFILQGTISSPRTWESDLRRDLDLTTYLNRTLEAPIQAIAIIGDTNNWDVRVVSRDGNNITGMSALVAAMLDALPHMWRAKVPAQQCLHYLESKLREFCVLSKTLADMLMSTDFCDMDTLTRSLNIDINDVPLLMAVATTHTPQLARRYGISYR